MNRLISVFASLILLLMTSAAIAQENPIKVHVSLFNVTGAANSQELKQTLQEILTSRLDSAQIMLVEKPEQAERIVIGSYAQFGKMFSLDILIKNGTNGNLVKVFEQGEGQEDVIPALGRLARKIDAELAKRTAKAVPAATASTVPVAVPVPAPPTPVLSPVAAAPSAPPPAAAQTPVKAPPAYVITPEPSAKELPGSWSSAPLDGVFTSIATGRTLPSGERELFVANDRTIRAYLKGRELIQLAEVTIPHPGKILAIDTADLDSDGTPELYVSIIDREASSSRVYSFNGTAFSLLAENQMWFFRGLGSDFSTRTIFAQEIEAGGKYYGAVKELVKSGTRFTTKNSLRLPRTGNIFNVAKLSGASGTEYYVVLDEDGYLVVYPPDGAEVWKSSEKFGGSEGIVSTGAQSYSRATGDLPRWTFLEQRMTLLKDGTLLVPHNEGSFSFGKNRSFDRYSLFGFTWTGAVLKEKWHTRQSPGYLADYACNEASGEVVLLEVVQKSGMFTKGKTVISINRIE
ncbi:MAG TPA: VCBS repeat-containing protein [Desulfuromonadales bacterium]|nr:VCBS repeat-containing protein [Desulfuromonadales bacterium]